MKIPETKIKVLYKRVQYQEVEISKREGFDSISTADDLVSFANNIKDQPLSYTHEDDWEDCPEQGVTVETISYSEA